MRRSNKSIIIFDIFDNGLDNNVNCTKGKGRRLIKLKFKALETKTNKLEGSIRALVLTKYKDILKGIDWFPPSFIYNADPDNLELITALAQKGTSPLTSPFIRTGYEQFQGYLINIYFFYFDRKCFFLDQSYKESEQSTTQEFQLMQESVCMLSFGIIYYLSIGIPISLEHNQFYWALKNKLFNTSQKFSVTLVFSLALLSYIEYGFGDLNSSSMSMSKAISVSQAIGLNTLSEVFQISNTLHYGSMHYILLWNFCVNYMVQDSIARHIPVLKVDDTKSLFSNDQIDKMYLHPCKDIDPSIPILSFKVTQLFITQSCSQITELHNALTEHKISLDQYVSFGISLATQIDRCLRSHQVWFEAFLRADKEVSMDPLLLTKAYYAIISKGQYLLIATMLSEVDKAPNSEFNFDYKPSLDLPNLGKVSSDLMKGYNLLEFRFKTQISPSHSHLIYTLDYYFVIPLYYATLIQLKNLPKRGRNTNAYLAKLKSIAPFWPVINRWVQKLEALTE